MKSEAPNEHFADRVFDLVSREYRYPRDPSNAEWPAVIAELRDIGARGVDGLIRGLKSSDWRTRVTAAQVVGRAGIALKPVLDLVKAALDDTNKNVRICAMNALMRLDVAEARKQREFVPLIVPRLADPTRQVRSAAAYWLREQAAGVPLEAAAKALAKETDGRVLRGLKPLVLAILEAGEEKVKS